MVVIGITGNLGTGKSTVCNMLAELGAVLINADELGHEVIEPGKPAYLEVVAAFSKSILKPNEEIDRSKLGEIVFNDDVALARLNQITHPRIYQLAEQKIEEQRQTGTGVVVVEAALFIEAGWTPLVDQLWVTVAPEATIVKRLKSSRGLSEEQILDRLHAQMPQEEKAKQADAVIDTDCSMDELRARVTELWRGLAVEIT